ncbi:M35 family metallo-endopeptidase [Variovorax sp. J2P1-59]|uniref:M35 family metallo-endopeptidase n=1 Tax=Variovorax flavidus TaxID=3053501 RepID=UPI0025750C77|nr:M35 family metallo-endopeptidase [Variovorax sp. J2P1-59]MDM0075663.1 M35 family metallo-endopeptidase [Variovorax sp. J2P1-59]
MERKFIVVGDPPAPGGCALPHAGRKFTIHGHQVALIGGRVHCEGCNSVGVIAKAGGPRRMQFISEVALEGDVVLCHCPTPQALIATLQHRATYEDMAGGSGTFDLSMVGPGWFRHDATSIAASKKLVDSEVIHPPEAEQTENICPNMTNKEFCTMMLDLRDKAVSLISKKRLPELRRWGEVDQARVREWFGVADLSIRDYLRNGLSACESVLKGLDCRNFIRLTSSGKLLSCVIPSHGQETVAMVCKPDVETHTIAFNTSFCEIRSTSSSLDSKLSTLIHEVTHFNDTFGSLDAIYYLAQSRSEAKLNPRMVKVNADSIAGYVVWGEVFHAS